MSGLGWSDARTIAISVLLAFVFGYGPTLLPLARAAFPLDRRLVAAGRGHAVVHGRHGGDR